MNVVRLPERPHPIPIMMLPVVFSLILWQGWMAWADRLLTPPHAGRGQGPGLPSGGIQS